VPALIARGFGTEIEHQFPLLSLLHTTPDQSSGVYRIDRGNRSA
jgi:hypothetical protein